MNDELKELLQYGILDEEDIRQKLRMKKLERILLIHPHPITQLSNGRWQTYYDDPEKGKRIEIKRASREKILDKLYTIYYGDCDGPPGSSDVTPTISHLFDEWIEYKKAITNSENTITRYHQLYMKYLCNKPITLRNIRDITKLELNSFCNDLVKSNSLSLKGWMNIKTILNGIFGYAMDKEILTTNPLDRVKITVKYRQVNRKIDGSQCFDTTEIEKLRKYMMAKYHETDDVVYIAPLLQLLTGLRVGELVTLKWEDVSYEKHLLHVVREESRIRETNECIVVNHTKGNQDRFVCLVPQAEKYLRMMPRDSAYIFSRDSERLTARQVTWVYEHYSKDTGNKMKRSHKARKTYASVLYQAGVPIEKIREQLGHKDLVTTWDYIFNPLPEGETYARIVEALA